VDGYGLPSWRSSWHVLYMTVKRRGNQRGDTFSALVPPFNPPAQLSPLLDPSVPTNFFGQPADARVQDNANTYNSQWAEVAYFLVCTGTTIEPGTPPDLTQPLPAGVTPLYALYRVERLVTPDNRAINSANANAGTPIPATSANQAAYAQMSWVIVGADPVNNNPGTLYFNNPGDLPFAVPPTGGAVRGYRSFYFTNPDGTLAPPVNYTLDPTAPSGRGATLLATNVVSFHVRVLRGTAPGFGRPNRQYPEPDYADVSYDSSGPAMTVPGTDNKGNPVQVPVFVTAMAVSLRVWDQKTQQARQITVVQDM
jgi:hypothetical protein